MSVECFLDTNVLVYAVSSAAEDAKKKEKAIELIETEDFGLSSQVLQEFYVTVTRKISKPLDPDDALALLDGFRQFPVAWPDYAAIVAAVQQSIRHRLSYWDGAILAAAQRLGAKVVFTEDLNDGQQYGSIRVENPFAGI